VNSSPPEQRTGLLKDAPTMERLDDDSTEICVDNVLKRYQRRPLKLSDWCLADFSSKLSLVPNTKGTKGKSTKCNNWLPENPLEEENEDIVNEDKDTETKYRMEDGSVLTLLKKQKVLRYVRFNKDKDPEKHYRELLFMFIPWRNETIDLLGHCCSYLEKYEEVKEVVDAKKFHYDKLSEVLNEAIQIAERHNEMDSEEEESNYVEEEKDDSFNYELFASFDPGPNPLHNSYDIGHDLGIQASNDIRELNLPNLMADSSYYELVRSLNAEQRKFFDHILHWFKTCKNPLYQFCTSGAGCGKTYLLRTIYQALLRLFSKQLGQDPESLTILLLSYTGKASFSIGGNTIHSTFLIPVNQSLKEYRPLTSDKLNSLATKLDNVQLLIIDECSMVSNVMLNWIDQRMQEVCSSPQPFGAKSVLCFGDLYQLPPIQYGQIFADFTSFSNGMDILSNNIWKQLFTVYELHTIMRQRDDADFAHLLNRLREGKHTQSDISLLETRKLEVDESNNAYPITIPHLFFTNANIDKFNETIYDKSLGPKCKVMAYDIVLGTSSTSVRNKILSAIPKKAQSTKGVFTNLPLAEHVRYEMTHNIDPKDGLVNGAAGILKKIDFRLLNTKRPSVLWVAFENTKIGQNLRHKHSHLYTSEIDHAWTPVMETTVQFQVGSWKHNQVLRRQFPLRPAAAKSIHRSQGETLEKFVIDLSCYKKIAALHYVGLSRATNINSLSIVNLQENKIHVDKQVHAEMERLRSSATISWCIPFFPSDNFQCELNN
jgi:hypothetical protein